MKQLTFYFILLSFMLVSCYPSASDNITDDRFTENVRLPEKSQSTLTEASEIQLEHTTTKTPEPTPTNTPTPTQPPNPFIDFYGCQMQLEFLSGPLEGQSTEFEILDKSYFQDKGDKFAVGKGTAIFYGERPYLILHSSYVNGNILRPMEAEFIRKYLEHWGNKGNETILGQIDALIGSEAEWRCEGESVLKTTVEGAVRLSHAASNRLWLEPENINEILSMREGISSEWIGEINATADPSLFVGFCGWGPPSIESGRYTYYRYLLNFEVQDL